MKLVENWKDILLKSYSTLANYIAGIITTIYLVVPTLNDIPPEIKSIIPIEYLPFVSLALLVISIIGRVIQQRSISGVSGKVEELTETPSKKAIKSKIKKAIKKE